MNTKSVLLIGAELLLVLLTVSMFMLGVVGNLSVRTSVVSFDYITTHPVERIFYILAFFSCAFGSIAIADIIAIRIRGRGIA